jgi:hypothetical protein
MQRALAVAVALTSTIAFARSARADVVDPPREGCPEGTSGRTCHGPPYCAPNDCDPSGGCPAGSHCDDRDLCVYTNTCGGLGGPVGVTAADHACGPGGACPSGSTCQTVRVCLPGMVGIDSSGGDGGEGPVHATYCACRAAGAGTRSAGASLGMLALALGALARRRGAR